jgi:hypothetical protein
MSHAGERTVGKIAPASGLCQEERRAMKAKLPQRIEKARLDSRRAGEQTAGRQ